MTSNWTTTFALAVLTTLIASSASAATCEELAAVTVPHAAVTSAQTVAAGTFTPPAGRGGRGGNPFAQLPAFCRVRLTLTPTSRSNIQMELWMPSAGWNGKMQVVGNGGWAGNIGYPALATALAAGYAAASTDTGHSGGAANTVVNDDVLIDFAHRSIHETTVASKRVITGFYGNAPRFSYFAGCSTGGRQALTAAQRYPDDFDGIVAGDPAIYGIAQTFGQVWFHQAINKNPASAIPPEKTAVLHDAVLKACDAGDGAKDGVLENPMACRFDPKVVACTTGGDGASCLTPAQVEAAQKIYGGARDMRTSKPVHPGLEIGSEANWGPTPGAYAIDFFKYVVFKDANWDPNSLNYDGDLALIEKPENRILDAASADLRPFFGSGGKLLMYHGWGDAGIPARSSVDYYEQVRSKTGTAADASLRLFMVPGMGHCGGGQGTSTFDMVAALDTWVTKGQAPESIPASRVNNGVVDRTRPLCAYPKRAVYKGSGSIDDATSFECR